MSTPDNDLIQNHLFYFELNQNASRHIDRVAASLQLDRVGCARGCSAACSLLPACVSQAGCCNKPSAPPTAIISIVQVRSSNVYKMLWLGLIAPGDAGAAEGEAVRVMSDSCR